MNPRSFTPANRKGIALVLVLAFLVLITALVIAFFSSVTTELSGAKGYASEAVAKELSNSATQTVMGIIGAATSGTDAGGNTLAWASQPGMIRTYDTNGNPSTYYKLYSSGTMAISSSNSSNFNLASEIDPAWNTKPALYTDLNSPILVSSSTGTVIPNPANPNNKYDAEFPIVDGNDLVPGSSLNPPVASFSGSACLTYNASGNGKADIEGFYVVPPSTYTAAAPVSGTNNPVPMPVQWIYVQKNGQLISPSVVISGSQIGFTTGSNGVNPQNPIVGRIAFWTDDETCKVNVNTASEGNFMDTPRMQGVTDFALAKYPTAQNEYQRYPGHPAMTCLSTVLGSLYPVDHTLQASDGGYYTSPRPATYPPYEPYVDMAPRLCLDDAPNPSAGQYGDQGSQAGTAQYGYNAAVSGTANTAPPALTTKSNRLYASVDEFLFQGGTAGASSRALNPPTSGTTSLTPAMLQEAKFFLTADSRAPDVNLFNQPRIVTWPVNVANSPAYRTTYDQALAFCGQIGETGSAPDIYYFQRQRNDHPTNDLPATPGGNGLGRNRTLIQYLQNLTSRNIPGFGGNFVTKYPAAGGNGPLERDQILTEIFDYIRCLDLIDLSSTSTANGAIPMTHPFAPVASGANYSTTYAGTNGNGTVNSGDTLTANAGEGQVVPIFDTVTQTRGFGRFPTISEAAFMFIATGWNDGKDGSVGLSGSDVNYQGPAVSGSTVQGWYPVGSGPAFKTIFPAGASMPALSGSTIQVQAMLLLNFFDPSQGNVWEYGTYRIQVLGLNNFTWTSTLSGSTYNMGFLPNTSTGSTYQPISNMASDYVPEYAVDWGGNMGFRGFFSTEGAGLAPTSTQYYPFFSTAQDFPYQPPRNAGTLTFSGGPITINFLLPNNTPNAPGWPAISSTGPAIQTITLNFPQATIPVPTYAATALNPSGSTPRVDRGSFNVRMAVGSSAYGANPEFITGTTSYSAPNGATGADVVRSVRAYPGDIRMIAGQMTVNGTMVATSGNPGYFDSQENEISQTLPLWNYFSASQDLVHSLRESCDYPFGGAILGQLVPNVSYAGLANPFSTTYSGGLANFSSAGNNATAAGAFIGGGTNGLLGDWDNGFGYTADGPYINKPDEGDYNFTSNTGGLPYFGATNYNNSNTTAGQSFFSPNRLMASPVMFGSLSTGVARNIPWMTLLFCPNPAAIADQGGAFGFHPGFGAGTPSGGAATPPYRPPFTTPPDHLLLDLFNMPVVEPYPISEPLSTAGRINMNYQIAPFTYIERNTGLRAILKSERMTVVPNGAAGSYKNAGGTAARTIAASGGVDYDFRVPINADQTLAAFDNYFSSNNDIFRSPSQICDMFLYPARDALLSSTTPAVWDAANSNITTFWKTHQLTGDNSRERPYATIYPRLTTKSNTFTIHMRIQTLKQLSADAANGQWNEAKDVVTSEYRGSQTIERYVDPSDPTIPDFASAGAGTYPAGLGPYYKFRVVSTKKFAP